MELSVRASTIMRYSLGAMLALTVGLLMWQHYGMDRVLELSVAKQTRIELVDDRRDGGISRATLVDAKQSIRMSCDIVPKAEWPFCRFFIPLSQGTKGLDLSGYTDVSFDIGYMSPGPRMMRASIIDFEPGLSAVDEFMSAKVNEAEFAVPSQGIVKASMHVFHPAAWWLQRYNVSLEKSDSRFDNVVRIELSTGNGTPPGHYDIELRSIRFYGKWIRQSTLLGVLVVGWILMAVFWPIFGALQMRRQLRSSQQHLALMSEINRALQIEAQELVGQAHTDPLTGALNRQGLRAAMMSTSTLLCDPMSVVFVDLDHFKRVNDQHGHEVGDAVLRAFASFVTGEIRSTDKLVRWGGEEFLIICPTTTADQAFVLASKLRKAMPTLQWPAGLRMTASFGIASLHPSEEIGAVIKRADEALYKAKANGRDRVEVAMDAEPTEQGEPEAMST